MKIMFMGFRYHDRVANAGIAGFFYSAGGFLVVNWDAGRPCIGRPDEKPTTTTNNEVSAMHLLRPAMLLFGLAAGAVLADGASVRMHVSATVPPRPCEYPDTCPGTSSPATSASYASIVDGRIRYVGPNPAVTRQGDLLTVRF